MPQEDDWIKEEELLLKFAESGTFNVESLEEIQVTIIYVDRTHDIVDAVDGMLPLLTNPASRKSILEWTELKQYIDSRLKHNGLRYLFTDLSYYHLAISYDQLDVFNPSTQLIKLEKDKNIKIVETLPILHDISQIFVILREVIPAPSKNSLKSILKTGSKIGKTKKVRISENSPEVFASSRRSTRKTS